ncbi:MAG: LTA synthase family protein [Clostridia bacterium]|nr:LTA synthase family protein [Clostridia bacterium]
MKKIIETIKNSIDKNIIIISLSLLLMSVVLFDISQLISMQSFSALAFGFTHFMPFLLFVVIVLTISLILYGVAGKLTAVWIVTALGVVLITLINFYKMQINGMPLMLSEFSMAGEMWKIMQFALPQIKVSSITAFSLFLTVLITAVTVFADIKLKAHKFFRMGALITGVGLVLVMEVFTVGHIWAKACTGDAVSQSERIEECGVITALYCTWEDSRFDKAPQISDDVLLWIDNYSGKENDTPDEEKVNVIFLMSESFFDITKLDNLTFKKDPLPNFHALAEKYASGEFISTSYAGGTGMVEMELLSGICGPLLKESDSLPYLDKKVYASMPCIGDVFKINGYRREFLHSFSNELYNRSHIYDAWGFDSVRFEESFPIDTERSGGYISDMALSEEIISVYENKGDKPLMLYAVSMENHQPYGKDKYPGKSGFNIKSDQLTKEELDEVDALVYGLNNADAALGYLTEYFDKADEKVMIVFWGDHLPNLTMPDGESLYEKIEYYTKEGVELGLPDQLVKALCTDYVIWTNYETDIPDRTRGNTLFGMEIAKLAGLELTDYYAWLDEYMSDCYMMYSAGLYVDEKGSVTPWIPPEVKEKFDNYKAVIYDIVYKGNTLFEKYR